MAGRGPTPKPDDKRERRNEPTFPTVELDADARAAAPTLPDLPGGGVWAAGVTRWYGSFCDSPMAAQLLPFDWERVFAIARLRQAFELSPSSGLMAEIRQNEAKLGATPDDRLRLRWRLASARKDEERSDAAGELPAQAPRRRRDPRLKLVEGKVA